MFLFCVFLPTSLSFANATSPNIPLAGTSADAVIIAIACFHFLFAFLFVFIFIFPFLYKAAPLHPILEKNTMLCLFVYVIYNFHLSAKIRKMHIILFSVPVTTPEVTILSHYFNQLTILWNGIWILFWFPK